MSTVTQAVQGTVVWRGFRVWQRNRDAFNRAWRVELGGIVVEPFIMLAAIGFGLGQFVEDVGDLRYAEWFAPGAMASLAMFHATFDSSFGAYIRMETNHIYEAYLFTPLSPEDIVVGEIMWAATRAVFPATFVLLAAAMFGVVVSPLAVLAIPCAFLIGLTIASIAMIATATAATIGSLNNFFTLFILPMFWISGVFFPIDRLPNVLQTASWALPLTPATALTRGLFTGETSWLMAAWALELLAFSLVAFWVASVLMRRRLIK